MTDEAAAQMAINAARDLEDIKDGVNSIDEFLHQQNDVSETDDADNELEALADSSDFEKVTETVEVQPPENFYEQVLQNQQNQFVISAFIAVLLVVIIGMRFGQAFFVRFK